MWSGVMFVITAISGEKLGEISSNIKLETSATTKLLSVVFDAMLVIGTPTLPHI